MEVLFTNESSVHEWKFCLRMKELFMNERSVNICHKWKFCSQMELRSIHEWKNCSLSHHFWVTSGFLEIGPVMWQYTIYNIQYTIYNGQYTIYNGQYIIYNIQWTIYNIQYTIYSIFFFSIQTVVNLGQRRVLQLVLHISRSSRTCWKELSFCHKLRCSNPFNLAARFPRPLMFQTINSGRSNSLSLKYQRFTPIGCKDIGVRKWKIVAKTQFL